MVRCTTIVTEACWIIRIEGYGYAHVVEGDGGVLAQVVHIVQKLIGKWGNLDTDLLAFNEGEEVRVLSYLIIT
jgi:hypothetical protein